MSVAIRVTNLRVGYGGRPVVEHLSGTFAAGSVVYRWRFADGSSVDVPVHRRFGIQQARCGWVAFVRV